MPVRDHCAMLSKQFLLQTALPEHPNHQAEAPPPPPPGCRRAGGRAPRTMKKTLQTEFKEAIKDKLPSNNSISRADIKLGMLNIHTECVEITISNQADNKVLNKPAPDVDKSERKLARRTRTLLTQLRSGYSSMLLTYLHKIKPTKFPSDLCPNCQSEPHTTTHLFSCPNNPTNLSPEDLWERPVEVARFLGLDTGGVGDLYDND